MVYYKHSHRHIHKIIRKHAPKSVRRATHFLHFKYEKFFLFIFFIFLAYIIFRQPAIQNFVLNLSGFNYINFLIAGILFAFGFSAPISIGFFLASQPASLLFATIIAGLGAAVGDIIIFKTIKSSFSKQLKELTHEKIVSAIENAIRHNRNILIRHYLLYIFVGILLATPLPDEIGVSMLAGLTTIKPMKLALIAFALHSAAIFIILYFSAIL